MISLALTISLTVAASALALAYGLRALWIPASATLVLSVPVLLRPHRCPFWVAQLTTGMYAAGAAAGASLGLNPWLLLIAVVGALSAWDLDGFSRQLGHVDVVEEERALSWSHLRRLLIVDGLGLAVAGLGLALRVRLSFGVAIALAVIALIAVSRLIRVGRRRVG